MAYRIPAPNPDRVNTEHKTAQLRPVYLRSAGGANSYRQCITWSESSATTALIVNSTSYARANAGRSASVIGSVSSTTAATTTSVAGTPAASPSKP